MTSPDILDQNPYSTQSYNRYSYVTNNPLKYVDPSGYYKYGTNYYYENEYIPENAYYYGMMNFMTQIGSASSFWENKEGRIGGFGPNYVVVGDGNTGGTSEGGDKEGTADGGFSTDNAVNWLNNNAYSSWKNSKGQCAKYIRYALEAGFGLKKNAFLGQTPVPARLYGTFLENQGFSPINTTNYIKGDIAVIQGYPGATSDPNGVPYGHIQMYNGSIWISDFKQMRDFWPGGGYRRDQPSFTIYRWGLDL